MQQLQVKEMSQKEEKAPPMENPPTTTPPNGQEPINEEQQEPQVQTEGNVHDDDNGIEYEEVEGDNNYYQSQTEGNYYPNSQRYRKNNYYQNR